MSTGKGDFNLQMDVPNELLERITRIGEKEERTRNGQLLWFLKDAVSRYELAQPEEYYERS